jgi:predicted glycoside hydrolase/deacetylase ChbG (UPF0249 family)
MKIIINGDDFGLSSSVNESIIYCHNKGYLTSASIMAYGKAFDEAADLAKKNPDLGIGIHLALDGPFDILYQNYDLFRNKKEFFNKEYVIDNLKKHKFKTSDIIKEYSKQIEKVLEKKIKISHLDHHHHLHLYFQVLRALIHVAKKYNIKYIRSQRIILHHNKAILNRLYRNIHQSYLRYRHNTIDGYFDLIYKEFDKYDNEKERLKKLLSLNISKIEIVTHPVSIGDFESSFLTDKTLKDLFRTHKLVNYHQI